MQFISEKLDNYIVKHSQEEPEILQELYRETHKKILQPIMLSGHYQGRVLSMISKLIRPKTILEIGTYTGYSAICLSEGLQKNGVIHTIDVNEELETIQNKYFKKAGIKNSIIQHFGNALSIIPNIKENFDLVFIDADKSNYVNYLPLVLNKLKSGGVMLSDNVLWYGKVLEQEIDDIATKALQEYNTRLKNHPDLETIILPIRDGLSISRKK